MVNLTAASLALFLDLARDAGNWSGSPLFGGNVGRGAAAKGNLTQLKQAELVTTWEDDDDGKRCMSTGRRLPPAVWVEFTPAGVALALSHGVDLRGYFPPPPSPEVDAELAAAERDAARVRELRQLIADVSRQLEAALGGDRQQLVALLPMLVDASTIVAALTNRLSPIARGGAS